MGEGGFRFYQKLAGNVTSFPGSEDAGWQRKQQDYKGEEAGAEIPRDFPFRRWLIKKSVLVPDHEGRAAALEVKLFGCQRGPRREPLVKVENRRALRISG